MHKIKIKTQPNSVKIITSFLGEMLMSETLKTSFPSLISFPNEIRLYWDNAMFSLKANLETSLESPTRFLSSNI